MSEPKNMKTPPKRNEKHAHTIEGRGVVRIMLQLRRGHGLGHWKGCRSKSVSVQEATVAEVWNALVPAMAAMGLSVAVIENAADE